MRRPFAFLSAGAASAAVIAGAVLALWSMGSSAAERERFSTLSVTPHDVDFYMAVNTEPASPQWIALAGLLDSISVEDAFRDAWSDLLADQDIEWDKDIVALLGDEAYVAVTDWSAIDDGRGVIAVAQLRNSGRARSLFVDRVTERLDEDLEQTAYEGETIYLVPQDLGEDDDFFDEDWEEPFDDEGIITDGSIEVEIELDAEDFDGGFPDSNALGDFDFGNEGGDPFAVAFVDGLAILGISQADVEGVIDVVHGRAPSVLENQRFTALQSQQLDDFLLWGYADVAAGVDALEEFLDENADNDDDLDSLSDALDSVRDASDRVTFVVSAAADHFVIDVNTLYPGGEAPDNAGFVTTPFESEFAQRVPGDSVFFAAGYDPYNGVYRPLIDALGETEFNENSYCSNLLPFGFPSFEDISFGPSTGNEGDPVYGRFYGEDGAFDFEAYEAWQEQTDAMFTLPDGSYDYEGYSHYIDGLYEAACAETKTTLNEIIAEFEEEAGFRLDEDLLSLMTGEVALSLHLDDLASDEPEFRLLGLAEVLDAARVESSVELLEQYLQRESDGDVVVLGEQDGIHRIQFEGISLFGGDEGYDYGFEDEGGFDDEYGFERNINEGEPLEFAWAASDGVLVAGYPAHAVSSFVDGSGGPKLSENRDWRRTMELLPPEKTLVAFVNIAQILERVGEMEDVEAEFREATGGDVELSDLRPLRSLGISTANIDGGTTLRIVVVVND